MRRSCIAIALLSSLACASSTEAPPSADASAPDARGPTTGKAVDAMPRPDVASASDAAAIDGAVTLPDASEPTAPGAFAYESIPTLFAQDLTRVRWHSSGEFALILSTGGLLHRYDRAAGSVSQLTAFGDVNLATVTDIDIANDGSFFLITGVENDGGGVLWRVDVDGALALTYAKEHDFTLSGEPISISAHPSGSPWAIAMHVDSSNSRVELWEEGSGIIESKSFNAFGGISDAMWADPTIYGNEAVITSHGQSGTDSKTSLVGINPCPATTSPVCTNGWPGGFGNGGRASWRPSGTYGVACGFSSNKLYVTDGTWSSETLPVPTGASPQAIAWNGDGTRALILGRAITASLKATVVDYRPGAATAFDSMALVDQSIQSFDMAPWRGDGNDYLYDADWRPASACTEGLIVGTQNTLSFGQLIRYYDSSDPDCAPLE